MMEDNVLDIFVIHGNVPSSKNRMRWTGTHLVSGKQVNKWKSKTRKEWLAQAMWFRYLTYLIPKPYYIEFTFYRETWIAFDYINMAQIVQDQMVKHGWIEDDNADIVKPHFGDYICDPSNPRVVIKIFKQKPY